MLRALIEEVRWPQSAGRLLDGAAGAQEKTICNESGVAEASPLRVAAHSKENRFSGSTDQGKFDPNTTAPSGVTSGKLPTRRPLFRLQWRVQKPLCGVKDVMRSHRPYLYTIL